MAEGMDVVDAKVVVLGGNGVGKTCLLDRFVHGSFNTYVEATIGVSFMAKTIVVDGITYRFNIWDTTSDEGKGSATIVVYDITSASTFQVLKSWIEELQLYGPNGIVVAIAGNKSDLEDKRAVDKLEGERFAEQNGAIFAETSALSASNVDGLFVEIGRRLTQLKHGNWKMNSSGNDMKCQLEKGP